MVAKAIECGRSQSAFHSGQCFVAQHNRGAAVAGAAVQDGKEADPLAVRAMLLADFVEDQEIHCGEGLDADMDTE